MRLWKPLPGPLHGCQGWVSGCGYFRLRGKTGQLRDRDQRAASLLQAGDKWLPLWERHHECRAERMWRETSAEDHQKPPTMCHHVNLPLPCFNSLPSFDQQNLRWAGSAATSGTFWPRLHGPGWHLKSDRRTVTTGSFLRGHSATWALPSGGSPLHSHNGAPGCQWLP